MQVERTVLRVVLQRGKTPLEGKRRLHAGTVGFVFGVAGYRVLLVRLGQVSAGKGRHEVCNNDVFRKMPKGRLPHEKGRVFEKRCRKNVQRSARRGTFRRISGTQRLQQSAVAGGTNGQRH